MDWKSKRVVVTGGAGFLGASVVRKLQERGCEKVFVPRKSQYNLVEMTSVKQLYQDTLPEIVIHLAAVVGGIGANREHPGLFFYENLMMGIQMMEVGRSSGLEKFVAIGTVCAYPKFTPIPFREEDLWTGYPEETNAPYGLAKKMLLVQSQAYRQEYDFNSIYLLPVNLYGPGDNFDPKSSHVIPALIRKCVEARDHDEDSIQVWGTGNASREFLYVDDCAEAIVMATEKYEKSEPVNIGSGKEITIRDLVDRVVQLTGFRGEVQWDSDKPDGQPRRCLDIRRAQEEFGFRATTDFETGLRKTIDWYIRNKT